jgi:hypothetical protein
MRHSRSPTFTRGTITYPLPCYGFHKEARNWGPTVRMHRAILQSPRSYPECWNKQLFFALRLAPQPFYARVG